MGLRFSTTLSGRVWSVNGDRVLMIIPNGRSASVVEVRGVPAPPSPNQDISYDCVVTIYPRRGGSGFAYTVWHRDSDFVSRYTANQGRPASAQQAADSRSQVASVAGRRA